MLLCCVALLTPASPDGLAAALPSQPNFLVILADDLGYSDIGAFGGEIPTPSLDGLAASGLMLTNFHTAPACAPTRAMLLTGRDNHRVGLGKMIEVMSLLSPEYLGLPGYEGFLTGSVKTLPALLRDAGYRTYLSGKWHLGLDDESGPGARGFDRSYAMLEGAAGHFDDRQLVPTADHDRVMFREDGKPVRPGPGFYSSKAYADQLIEYLETGRDDRRPFFAYLSFTAPHWPLQAPAESIARQQGRYDAGYDAIYRQRIRRQQALGLVAEDFSGHPKPPGYRDWVTLSAGERRYSARLMEIYAAMVEDMDSHIGRVLETLRSLGELDNTMVLFFSDNGATGGSHVSHPVYASFIEDCCDNSYGAMGSAESYLVLGNEWARVSSGANKFYKVHTTQGGIHSPAILRFPGTRGPSGRYDHFLTVLDIMPTLLELAGVDVATGTSTPRGTPLLGQSFASLAAGSNTATHSADYVVGWEWNDHRALRRGPLKLVMSQPPLGDSQWKLYDMETDPHETRDLAEERPGDLDSMIRAWEQYAVENGVILDPGAFR